CGVALVLADNPSPRGVTPSPQPTQPEPPAPLAKVRGSRPPAAATPIPTNRRYASLGAARREIFSRNDTPLTTAVQNLVRDVIGQLPSHAAPFVVAFSGQNSAYAMQIAALGFARIGARVHIE